MTATLTWLDQSRSLVLPAMRDFLARLDEKDRAIAAYHLGLEPQAHQGKAIRPALAMLSAQAAGSTVDTGMPGAVAVELVHNFSLIHDDLMDGDTERRHRSTVWAIWGGDSAILAGDALLALANEVLFEADSPHATGAGALLARATRDLIRGQVLDLEFEQRDAVALQECTDMAAAKTGALLSASAAIGAVLAGAPRPVVEALSAFGAHLGLAFQLVDDLLGIWGDPETTGKPVYSDLRSRKKTLPVCYATAHGGQPGRQLAAWLRGSDPPGLERLPQLADLVERAGGRRWAAEKARERIDAATAALEQVPMADQPRQELIAIAQFVASREV